MTSCNFNLGSDYKAMLMYVVSNASMFEVIVDTQSYKSWTHRPETSGV